MHTYSTAPSEQKLCFHWTPGQRDLAPSEFWGYLPVHDWQKGWCMAGVVLHVRRIQSTDYSDFLTSGKDGVWRGDTHPEGVNCWEAKDRKCSISFDRHGPESLQVETRSPVPWQMLWPQCHWMEKEQDHLLLWLLLGLFKRTRLCAAVARGFRA